MEHFEQNALANSVLVPKLWKRYVDDIFTGWSHGKEQLNIFLSYLNNIHLSIKFNIEQENDQLSLSFLDIALTRNQDGSLKHSSIESLHSLIATLTIDPFIIPKLNLQFAELWKTVENVCEKESINKELAHLNVVLQQNGFPIETIFH